MGVPPTMAIPTRARAYGYADHYDRHTPREGGEIATMSPRAHDMIGSTRP